MNYKSCHNGPTLVLSNEKGLEVYGASKTEAEKHFYEFDLVLSLDSCKPAKTPILRHTEFSLSKSSGYSQLLHKYSPKTEHLRLIWPDMDVPNVDKEFWIEFCNVIKKKGRDRFRYDGKYKVMVHCIGGHGRTGTALCIMAHLCMESGFSDGKLLKNVRKLHCSHALESNSQLKYVEDIVGFTVEGSPYKSNMISYTNSNVLVRDINECLSNKQNIHLHNKDIDKSEKCMLCYGKVKIPIPLEEGLVDNKTKNRISSLIPITEEEKAKRKLAKVKLSSKCGSHNAINCRNCKEDIAKGNYCISCLKVGHTKEDCSLTTIKDDDYVLGKDEKWCNTCFKLVDHDTEKHNEIVEKENLMVLEDEYNSKCILHGYEQCENCIRRILYNE